MRATGVFLCFRRRSPSGPDAPQRANSPAVFRQSTLSAFAQYARTLQRRVNIASPLEKAPARRGMTDITTDWDNPVQTLRRSLRTAIPRGQENASGPSLPDAKLPPAEKHFPARPTPSLADHDLFLFGALSAPVSSCPLFCLQKHVSPRSKTERPAPPKKAAAPAEDIPQPLLFTSLSLFSRMRPARLRQRKKQRYGSVPHPHILFSIATSFTRL